MNDSKLTCFLIPRACRRSGCRHEALNAGVVGAGCGPVGGAFDQQLERP